MSKELDIKFPEIFYDGDKKHMYSYLETDPTSPFMGHTRAAVFIFAMALAKRDGLTPSTLKKPTKLPPNAFDQNMRTLMRSIMIEEKNNVYCIDDNIELRNMCQKYANAGIDKLYSKFKNNPINREDVLATLINDC